MDGLTYFAESSGGGLRGLIPVRRGQRVQMRHAPPDSFAARELSSETVYRVARIEWNSGVCMVRLAEVPGFAFRRDMFDVVA